jgi:glycosyltransferase involved in cell wall biosynthesis
MRVFQLTNMYPSAERPHWGVYIRSQIESLPAAGIENVGFYEIEGWRSKLNYMFALWELPQRVAAASPDLVHIHYGLSAIAASFVRRWPMVVSFCGNDLLGRPDETGRISRSSSFMAEWCKLAALRADAVIVKSEEMRRVIGDWADVEVIPNGVDFSLFNPVPREVARSRLGWPLDTPILLFPSNLHEARKNYACAKDAVAILLNRGLPIRLEWLWARSQAEVVLAMNAADIMLLPSFHEGSPNVVKEAMAVNLPVVSADVGDCRERLATVSPSAVVDRTPQAFADAIQAILACGRRSNGRAVLKPLSIDAVAGRVRGVYERAIEHFRARCGSRAA